MKKQLFTLLTVLMVVIGMKAQVTLIDPTLDGGFENGTTFASNSWSVAQGALTTRVWQIGTGQTGFSGTASAFIGDNSTTVGSVTASRTVHLYRSVSIPTGAENIILSFKYKQAVADNTFDFLKVFLNGNTPVSATTQTLNNLVTIDPATNNYSVFTVVTVTVPNSFAGTTNNLIFSFKADGVTPHAYGAIDDVSLTYVLPTCFSISSLNSNSLTSTSVNYTWTANGVATMWDIYYGSSPLTAPNATTVPIATVSANSFSISGLNPSNPYTIYVRSNCSVSDQSSWVQSNFTTLDPPCITPTSQASSLVFGGITNASISGTFTAATPTVSNYLIIRTLGTAPNTPTNGVSYTTGASVALGGTVVSVGSGTTFTSSTGIVGNTNYTYFIYTFNNAICSGGPNYNVVSPLTATVTTCPAKATALTTSSITSSSFNLSWTAPAGGSASAINYSIEISSSSTFTTGNLLGSPFMVSAPTTSIMVSGLNPAAIYYYRVTADNGCNIGATTSASVTTGSIPVDLQTTSLITPTVSSTGCYAITPIVVQIKNAGTTALDFSTNNATVYGAITGVNPQTFTTVISTGTLAANATMNVTLTLSYDMSASGVYSINAISILSTPDANSSNDMMAEVTRSNISALTPFVNVFTGFTGANLSTVFPLWREAAGSVIPTGTTSNWLNQTGLNGTGNITAKINLFSNTKNDWILTPKFNVTTGMKLTFDAAVTDFGSLSADPSGMSGTDDDVQVLISNDCGNTYSSLLTINSTNSLTTNFQNFSVDLSTFVGQNVVIGFKASEGIVNDAPDYDFHLDNINIANCFAPTALSSSNLTNLTADLSWTAPSLSTPSEYIYEVRSLGAVGSGTTGLIVTGTVTAPSTSVSVSGLTATSVYSVYVMSSCGVGSSSVWTPAKTFTTLCTPAVAPTAANSSQCGFGVSSSSVTGGTTYLWYATATSTTALQTSTLTTYTTAIGATTTFYVSNNDGTCLSPRVPVTTTVSIPESVMASATATALCPGSSTVLLSVNQATGTVYSFTWSANPSVGSGLTSPIVNQTVSVLPTAYGTYVYQVLASDGICATTSSVTILSSDVPNIFASASSTAICSDQTFTLQANSYELGSQILPSYTCTPSSSGSGCISFVGLNSLSRTSTCESGFYIDVPNSITTNLSIGKTYTLTLNTEASAITSVWFDWNRNGLFESSEWLQPYTTGTVGIVTVTVPLSSAAGITKMRVRSRLTGNTNGASDACSSFGSGEAEDYSINILTDVSNSIVWTWNPGSLNGSQVTTSVTNATTTAITQVFTVSATSTITGCSNAGTTSILINPLPSPVVATNATQCGIGVPTASVTGGTSYNWYATATSTLVLQSGTATNFTSAIGATTSWFVTNFNGTCESTRRQVTQTVTTPDAVMATSSATAICLGDTYTLQAINTGTTNMYSYTWTPTPIAGSGLASGVTGSTQIASPTLAGNYDYLVTAFDGVCTATASAMVTVNGLPFILASSNPSVVCSGLDVLLDAKSIAASAGTATVGVQSTTGILGSPYRGGSGSDYKAEWLFTAAELNAAGIQAGNITSISFSVPSGAAGNLVNYTLKMGATSSLSLGTTYASGLSTVLGPISYAPVNGLNTHVLTTPFNWDGVSNIIIDACNDGGSGSSINTSMNAVSNNCIYSAASGACGLLTGGTTGNRPVILFGSQVGTNVSSTMNFVWNPGAINSNTTIVNPVNTGTAAITMIYTVSVTNTLTGCSNTATTGVVVNPLPMMPLVTDGTQCGNGMPTASVTGGTSYNWYATATSTAVLQAGTSNNFTTNIGSSTTWFVSNFNGTCESPRVMVTQSVTVPDAIIATTSASAICPNGMVNLTATNTGTFYTYTYSWYAQPVSGSGMLTPQTGATVSVMPTLAGSYDYVLTGVDGVCTTTAVVNVLVNATPNLVASATPTMVCSGAVVNLNAINGNIGTVAIGTGTTTSSTAGITPYSSGWEGSREQYLITAAELQAANLAAGNITSLAFKVTSLGSGTFAQSKFTVKIAHTADASLASTYGTPVGSFVNVYGPVTQPLPTLGNNIYSFTSPFNWDGVSNILVDICHDNDVDNSCSLCYSSNSTVQTSTTSFNSVFGSYADNAQSCGMQASISISTFNNRPNMIFGGVVAQNSPVVYQWNPGAINSNTAMVNPINTGTAAVTNIYTVTVTNTLTSCGNSATVSVVVNPYPVVMATSPSSLICANYNTTLTATGATSYTWMPAGGSAANAVVSPSVATIYTVTGTTAGCSSTATVEISTNPSPTITVASSATSAVCPATSVTLTATGVATTYTWNPAISTTSTAIVSPNSTSVYTVMAEDLGCITTKTISVSVGLNPIVLLASTNSVICSGSASSSTINVTGTAVSFTWTPAVSTTTMAVVSPTTQTSYVVVGSSTLGCVTSKTISINVVNTPTLMVTTQNAPICAGSSATITSTGNATSYTWSPVGGNSSSAVVTPTGSTSSYTLTGENNGCSNTSVVTLTVSALPIVNAYSSPTVICLGQSATLSASIAATSYSWSNGANTISTVVTPTANANYTLTVSNGTCKASTTVSVAVNACIGLQELSANGISIYPNPTTDKLNIDINTDLVNNAKISIVDALGKLVISETLTSERTVIRTTNLDTGIYFVRIISNNTEIRVEKLIKQ